MEDVMPGHIDPTVGSIMVPGVGVFRRDQVLFHPPTTVGQDRSWAIPNLRCMGFYEIPSKAMFVPAQAVYLIVTG